MKHLAKVIAAIAVIVLLCTAVFGQKVQPPKKCINHFSFTFTAASGNMLKGFSKVEEVTFGTLGVNYKFKSKLNFGISILGTNAANFELENFLGSVMVNATYFPLVKHTLFIQPSLGYSIKNECAAYSVFSGWNQNIIKRLSVIGGIRYLGNIREGSHPSLNAELGIAWNM